MWLRAAGANADYELVLWALGLDHTNSTSAILWNVDLFSATQALLFQFLYLNIKLIFLFLFKKFQAKMNYLQKESF